MSRFRVELSNDPLTEKDFGIKAEIKEEFFERNLVDVGTSSKSVTIVDWKVTYLLVAVTW